MKAEDAIVLLTIVLVSATVYYAYQTSRTVAELRAARKVAIMPHVLPGFEHYGAGAGFPRIVNVGPGPAIDIDVEMWFEPGNGLRRRWTNQVLTTGDFREMILKDEFGEVIRMPALTEQFAEMRLKGTCRDAMREEYLIDETFNVRDWWRIAVAADERLQRGKRPEIVTALEKVAHSIDRLRRE